MRLKHLWLLILCGFSTCKSEKDMDRAFLPDPARRPRALATYPSDGMVGVRATDEISILFDGPMDEQKTADAFRLSSETASLEGAFRWEFHRMFFRPRAALQKGMPFTMILRSSAESRSGADLGQDLTVRFHVGDDIDAPRFLSSEPAHGATGIDPTSAIRLRFSEPMSYGSVASGLTISPSFSYSVSLQDAGREIVILPSNPLPAGTHLISYGVGFTDLAGIALANPGSVRFTVGTDAVRPLLVSASVGALSLMPDLLVAGVDRSDSITLTFSERMHRLSAEDAVTLSPSVPLVRTWNQTGDRLVLRPDPALAPETHYTLRVASSATDVAGNALQRESSFPFLTSATNSLRPRILEVRQYASSSSSTSTASCADGAARLPPTGAPLISLQPLDISQTIDMNENSAATTCVLALRFLFSEEMIRSSLVGATTTPQFIIHPDGGTSIDPSVYDIQLDPSDPHAMILYFVGDFPPYLPGIDHTPILAFTIRGGDGGATDRNGNTMLEDFSLYLTY